MLTQCNQSPNFQLNSPKRSVWLQDTKYTWLNVSHTYAVGMLSNIPSNKNQVSRIWKTTHTYFKGGIYFRSTVEELEIPNRRYFNLDFNPMLHIQRQRCKKVEGTVQLLEQERSQKHMKLTLRIQNTEQK